MKIGIEMRMVALGNAGGISLLLKGLLETVFRQHPEHDYLVFCTVFNRGLLEHVTEQVEFVTVPLQNYLDDVGRLACEHQVDVLFRTYPLDLPLPFPLAKQIFLIPDIQHEFFPEFFARDTLRARRSAFTLALSSAGAIATISEYARQTLYAQECTHCQDIFLVSPALLEEHRQTAQAELSPEEQALIPQEDFFLYPANLWPHKNHRQILQAFALFLRQTGKKVSFVCTGHADGWPALQAEFPELPVRHLGFVRTPLLRQLLRRARALVFFSLYEGFGMPLLEAFDAGTPVLCSNTTSLPEVGGDAVLSCDPSAIGDMAALMARILQEDELRTNLVLRGKQRLQMHSWEQSAQNFVAGCERVHQAALPETTSPHLRVQTAWPLVSIVTPSYNQGRFLRRTIESVLNQTYPHIEYRVLDGGSTDESVAILKSYGDRFPWVSEPDHGQAQAINKGFAQARGTIRAYLNSDDILLPQAVERVVTFFQQNLDCDLVYGQANYINEHDEITGTYNTAEYSFPRLMKDCCICQPACFWRSRVAKLVGPFDERLDYVMDYDYWLRIDRAGGRLAYLPETLACSRLYPETKTLSGRDKIFQEIFQVCKDHAGYVDIGFFHGFWHHLCQERDSGLPHQLRWLPRFQPSMAHLHHLWLNRHRYTTQRILAGVSRRLDHWVGRQPWPVAAVLNRLRRLADPLVWRKSVRGLGADNWMGPTCEVILRNCAPGQVLQVAGTAPLDMTLTVLAQGQEVGKFSLGANRFENICFSLKPEFGQRLCLRFSKNVLGPKRRKLSFLLEGTNLFSEQDIR